MPERQDEGEAPMEYDDYDQFQKDTNRLDAESQYLQRSGGGAFAIVSGGFWRRRFRGAPDVLAKTIELDGVRFAIVGVAESDSRGTPSAIPSTFGSQ
jgi:hypothetical protein